MKRLHDYLDSDKIKLITKEGMEFIGVPIVVNYADETASGEEELTIEGDKLYGFAESEIESIEILDEIEAIVYSGTKINIDYFIEEIMDEDHQYDIFEYFKESDSDDIEKAINELGRDYTEEEIRLVRIKFMSEFAN